VTDARLDLPQGTLDLLILAALSLEPMPGWTLRERVQHVSREALQIPHGSPYLALHRLERHAWISASGFVETGGSRAV
jgi:DNA-binding PadR family transcriptional regulator